MGLSNLPSRRINVITLMFSKAQVTTGPGISYYPQPSILVKGYLPARLARIDLPDYGQHYPTALNTLE